MSKNFMNFIVLRNKFLLETVNLVINFFSIFQHCR